jgi:hypothetical protein
MEFMKDLWDFLRVRKKFWLLPLIMILLILGVAVVLTAGSAIAPSSTPSFSSVSDYEVRGKI